MGESYEDNHESSARQWIRLCSMNVPDPCAIHVDPAVSAGAGAWSPTVTTKRSSMGTGNGISPLPLQASSTLAQAIAMTSDLPFGATDCALPMRYALEKHLEVDCFVVLTDNETWAGDVHPVKALAAYRKQTGIAARLVVVGMVSNGFTIADKDDAGMLDVVGFDTATPSLISAFARGDV